jgi:hypothetical protein
MAVSSDNSVDRLGDLCFVCDVYDDGLGGKASRANLLCGDFDSYRLTVKQQNPGAGLAKDQGGLMSNPTGGAGDQDDFSLKFVQDRPSYAGEGVEGAY